MKPKSLLILVVIAVALGAYIHFVLEKKSGGGKESERSQNKIVAGDTHKLNWASIASKGQEIILEKNSEGVWRMTKPIVDIISDAKIDTLRNALNEIYKHKTLFNEKSLKESGKTLATFGLDPAKVVLHIKNSEGLDQTFWIGAASPNRSGTYLKNSKNGDILLVSNELDYLDTQNPDDYREKKLITVDSENFAEASFELRGEKYKVEKDSNGIFKFGDLNPLPIDQEAAKSLLNKIGFLRANDFVDKLPLETKTPEIKIIVGFKEGQKDARSSDKDPRPNGAEIKIYKVRKKEVKVAKGPDDYDYYATSDRTPPSKIARYHFDNLSKSAGDLVQKDLGKFELKDIASVHIGNEGAGFSYKPHPNIYEVVMDKDQSKKNGNKAAIETSLEKIKNFKATRFLKEMPGPLPKKSVQIQIALKDSRQLALAAESGKGEDLVWVLSDGRVLAYSAPEKTFLPETYSLDEWTKTQKDTKLDDVKKLGLPETKPQASDKKTGKK